MAAPGRQLERNGDERESIRAGASNYMHGSFGQQVQPRTPDAEPTPPRAEDTQAMNGWLYGSVGRERRNGTCRRMVCRCYPSNNRMYPNDCSIQEDMMKKKNQGETMISGYVMCVGTQLYKKLVILDCDCPVRNPT